LVATPRGYTKHYYAGAERVASKLGGGGLRNINQPVSFESESPLSMGPAPLDPVNVIQTKWEQYQGPYRQIWKSCLNSLLPEMSPEVELSNLYDYERIQTAETFRYFYHPDHLGSASWITDSSGKAIQHLQYLPFGETRVDQRATGSNWSTRYSFSAKEKDEESGYGYFGARYYDSDISIWISVDPMANKYPSLTPYNYVGNRPTTLIDPDGTWVPGLDEQGNTTYTAEKGDNAHTFARQFKTNGKTESIFKNAKLSTADNGVKEGAVIKGDAVKKATGSDVLKGNWSNMTNSQKASQIMFGMMYSEQHNEAASNGAFAMNINDYVEGFNTPAGGLILDNVSIPLRGGGTMKLDQMNIAPASTIGNPPLILRAPFGGDEQTRTDGSSFASYRYECGRNMNARTRFTAISIAVPLQYKEVFQKSYR
jgi:RHS repeat-associated protein